ncbi:MAG TPA: hypothetical protein VKB81_18310 [Nitrospira sp.]|nr:hypothetical protein [Nitrospira sp.]
MRLTDHPGQSGEAEQNRNAHSGDFDERHSVLHPTNQGASVAKKVKADCVRFLDRGKSKHGA